MSNEPSASVYLLDVKVSNSFGANVDDQVEIEPDLQDNFEVTIVSVDPKNSDQITVINQDSQVTVEEYDDQVDANPVVMTDADPVVKTDTDPVVMTDADPVVMTDANPVVMTDADPVVMTDADPVGEVMCNVNNIPAVDSQAIYREITNCR